MGVLPHMGVLRMQVWNTRKGVAFALAGQSRQRLESHLEKLIPTLYRYTFDPNPRIAQAMKQVRQCVLSPCVGT